MYLLACATEFEMRPFVELGGNASNEQSLITGVGLVETTLSLCRRLSIGATTIRGVINFGVSGGYADSGIRLLDICMARKEVLGDLGICYCNAVEPFDQSAFRIPTEFEMDQGLFSIAETILHKKNIVFRAGTFVTVNSTSGTTARGGNLQNRHQALCENMEGAAIARVCGAYSIPCLEIRCVSNFVEDRNTNEWKLEEACRKCAEAVFNVWTEINE